MKALIIDDEVDLCLLIKSYLQRKGYQVFLAHTLSDGLNKLLEHQPSLLFLDNNLPDGLGWTEAPKIAASYPHMNQFLISAYHPPVPVMPEGTRYTVLEKPISFSDLEGEILAASATESNI